MSIAYASIISALKSDSSIDTLIDALNQAEKLPKTDSNNLKLRAELSFLLARALKNSDPARANDLANNSKSLYKRIKTNTLEDVNPILGWLLPSLMHEGIVNVEFPST